MGILSFFNFRKDPDSHPDRPAHANLAIDLGAFRSGSTALGDPPSVSDPFFSVLASAEVFEPKGQGVEIGREGGVLDYGLFNLDDFRGSFIRHGEALDIGMATTEDDIQKLFGAPYWRDQSDGEIILFYEYLEGSVEVQFEFPDGKSLGFVTMTRNGVLSEPEQRVRYGVNRAWPPE